MSGIKRDKELIGSAAGSGVADYPIGLAARHLFRADPFLLRNQRRQRRLEITSQSRTSENLPRPRWPEPPRAPRSPDAAQSARAVRHPRPFSIADIRKQTDRLQVIFRKSEVRLAEIDDQPFGLRRIVK